MTTAQTVYVKATNPNYVDALGNATVTITQKPVTVTADNKSKVYGTDDPAFTATVEGTLGNDTVVYTLSRAAGENVGAYAITPAGDASQGNYSVTYAAGLLTITKAPAEQNAVTATPYSGVYDAAAHSITASTAQAGSTLYYSKVGGTEATDWNETAPTWTDVTDAQTVYVKAVNPNYEDSFGSATVTITPATLTVTTPDAAKVYDGKALTAAGTIEGLVNGETVTFVTTGTQTEVGSSKNTYSLTWDGTAKQGNYKIVEKVGTLTVNALPSMTSSKTITNSPANGTAFEAGETVNFCIAVTNTGNIELTNVEVTDPMTGLDTTIASIAAGATETVTTSYTVTQEDIDNRAELKNVATVIPSNTLVTPQNPEVVIPLAEPSTTTSAPNVKTGDTSNSALYVLLLLVAAGAMVAAMKKKELKK